MDAIEWLNELEKKANMATSGEWECPGGCHIWREQNGKVYIIARCAPYNCLNNGWFIAAANPETVKRMIAEIRKRDSMFKWLIDSGDPSGDYLLPCPYHKHFDTSKRCPFWTPRMESVSDDASVDDWKDVVFGDEGYGCDDVNCGTHPSVCLDYIAEREVNKNGGNDDTHLC